MTITGSEYDGEDLVCGNPRTTPDCETQETGTTPRTGCYCIFEGGTTQLVCEDDSAYVRPSSASTMRMTLENPLIVDASIPYGNNFLLNQATYPNVTLNSMDAAALIFPPGTYNMSYNGGDGETYLRWIYDMEVSTTGYKLANLFQGVDGVQFFDSDILGYASDNYNSHVRPDFNTNMWVWKYVDDGPDGSEAGRDCRECRQRDPDPENVECLYYGKNEILDIGTPLGVTALGGVTNAVLRLSVEIIQNPEADKHCGIPVGGLNAVGVNDDEDFHSDTVILKLQIVSLTKISGTAAVGKVLREECYPCVYWCYREISGYVPTQDEFLPIFQTKPGITYWRNGFSNRIITIEHSNPFFEG